MGEGGGVGRISAGNLDGWGDPISAGNLDGGDPISAGNPDGGGGGPISAGNLNGGSHIFRKARRGECAYLQET